MRNRTGDCGAARVCKGINLRGREAYATVPNNNTYSTVCTRDSLVCTVSIVGIYILQYFEVVPGN